MQDINIANDGATQAKQQDLSSFIFPPLLLWFLNAMPVENLNSFSAPLYVWAGFFVDQLKKAWDPAFAAFQVHSIVFINISILRLQPFQILPQWLLTLASLGNGTAIVWRLTVTKKGWL